MATQTGLQFLQSWYQAQCNGSWEHGNGVTIETLATPGWMVTIELMDTALETRDMQPVIAQRSDSDWISCKVEHNRFRGEGDSAKLGMILQVFQNWAANNVTVK